MRHWQLIVLWACVLAYCLLCWTSVIWLLAR